MSSYNSYFTRPNPMQMKCTICSAIIKYENGHKHSSTLRNHFETKHRNIVAGPSPKRAKITNFFSSDTSTSKLPNLPTLNQKAITACCSSHPLPFEVFEDPFFQWAFNTANTNRQKVADRVTEIADEWQKEIKESLRNTFVTVVRQ